VALLFAICGAWSAARFLPLPDFPERMDPIVYALPFPFALLCTLLFLRTLWAILIVPWMALAWLAAIITAVQVAVRVGIWLPPACVGGTVGGLVVALSAAVAKDQLRSLQNLVVAGIVGGIAAVPFGFWLWGNSQQPLGLWLSFAIWQAAVGTYLYAICTGPAKEPQPEGSPGQ
jgi:ABC-type thiamin/hydroxymethylpyrimidine transport system permease subunit